MSVGEMATILAHQINQPLASIVNCLTAARTLLERRGGPERLREAIDLAYDQAGQAAAAVARIREFVRTREPRRLAVLTRREKQVLELVVAGKFNKTIADVLGISIKTVELHRSSLMGKLGVRTVPDLVKIFLGYQ